MRTKSFKVSIIVPAYNVENYIVRCINSLQNQTYKNIEIIVVDDGSTDSTIDMVEDLKANDDRILLIKKQHVGPNIARMNGLKISSGEYVMFVDSDDFIIENAVADLVQQFEKYNVDTIRFNGIKFPSGEKFNTIYKDEVIDHKSVIELLLTTNKLNNLCFQAFKAKCLKEDYFNIDLFYGEDYYSNLMIHQNTNDMLLFSGTLYHYCFNPKSTTRKKTREQVFNNISDRIFISTKAIAIASDYDMALRNRVICSQMEMIAYSIFQLKKVKKYTKMNFMEDMEKVLPERLTSSINRSDLKKIMKSLNIVAIIKYRIIMALLDRNYGRLWRYMLLYDFAKRLKLC